MGRRLRSRAVLLACVAFLARAVRPQDGVVKPRPEMEEDARHRRPQATEMKARDHAEGDRGHRRHAESGHREGGHDRHNSSAQHGHDVHGRASHSDQKGKSAGLAGASMAAKKQEVVERHRLHHHQHKHHHHRHSDEMQASADKNRLHESFDDHAHHHKSSPHPGKPPAPGRRQPSRVGESESSMLAELVESSEALSREAAALSDDAEVGDDAVWEDEQPDTAACCRCGKSKDAEDPYATVVWSWSGKCELQCKNRWDTKPDQRFNLAEECNPEADEHGRLNLTDPEKHKCQAYCRETWEATKGRGLNGVKRKEVSAQGSKSSAQGFRNPLVLLALMSALTAHASAAF